MNPTQRRGLLFMMVAMLVGVGVFVAVANYVRDVSSQVGDQTTVYRARSAIDLYVPLGAGNLEAVQIPLRWSAPTARLPLRQIEGRRAGFRIEPGTYITSDMLIPPSALSSTEREVAINVDSVTGIAGRVRPGDSVDVYAVFADVPGLPKQVRVLVRNVRVVSIGGKQTVPTSSESSGIGEQDVLPVTLALEPEDARAVTFAHAFAQEVRLVGLPNDVGVSRGAETDTFDARDLGGKAIPEGVKP